MLGDLLQSYNVSNTSTQTDTSRDDEEDEPSTSRNTSENNSSTSEVKINLCKICYARAFSKFLFPCGHLLCKRCVRRVTRCPFCRRHIRFVDDCFP